MSEWREHIAGPMLRGALLCARCGEVLWVEPPDAPARTGSPWPTGCRMASDGENILGNISGWPYTPCEPWKPVVGDLPARRYAPAAVTGGGKAKAALAATGEGK